MSEKYFDIIDELEIKVSDYSIEKGGLSVEHLARISSAISLRRIADVLCGINASSHSGDIFDICERITEAANRVSDSVESVESAVLMATPE